MLMMHRRSRAAEQRREQYWRQQLKLEREQNQAHIAQLAAIQAERTRLLASHQHTLQKLTENHKQSLIAKDQEYRAAIAKLKRRISQQSTQSVAFPRAQRTLSRPMTQQVSTPGNKFKYKIADICCLGHPVDYVVFDGWSDMKAEHPQTDRLSIVFLAVQPDVLTLTPQQRAISRAIAAGRIRLEIMPAEPPALLSLPKPADHRLQRALDSEPQLSNAHLVKTKIETSVDHHAYRRAYQAWLEEEDQLLRLRYSEGATVHSIAMELQRKPSAIRSRLRKLGQI